VLSTLDWFASALEDRAAGISTEEYERLTAANEPLPDPEQIPPADISALTVFATAVLGDAEKIATDARPIQQASPSLYHEASLERPASA
jgi:hypothetical protein